MAGLVKVLSIDGGGIRGIIPAHLLAAIERGANAPICELFDLIAGTSTGGIIALGLTAPGPDGKPARSAEDIVRLYSTEGKRILSLSPWAPASSRAPARTTGRRRGGSSAGSFRS